MNVVRQIYDHLPDSIKTPNVLKNRRVEVIMLPFDEGIESKAHSKGLCPIDEFIGAWEVEPLVRPNQGAFEFRQTLE